MPVFLAEPQTQQCLSSKRVRPRRTWPRQRALDSARMEFTFSVAFSTTGIQRLEDTDRAITALTTEVTTRTTVIGRTTELNSRYVCKRSESNYAVHSNSAIA